jgi:hypothetical protein
LHLQPNREQAYKTNKADENVCKGEIDGIHDHLIIQIQGCKAALPAVR